MLDRLDETIVAVASPPGDAPLGIVRLSGARALAIADQMARLHDGHPLSAATPSRRYEGECRPDDAISLPATWYIFRAPHSYTREDLVEIHTIGNAIVLEMLRRRLLGFGALPAEPGEFTARAFLHGGLSLAEAESVAAVIRAQSDAQLRAARRLGEGRITAEATTLRDELADMLALVEAGIDFVEEPVEFITTATAARRLAEMAEKLGTWLAISDTLEAFDALPRILLLGPPNAGKSSLLNRLSGMDRAICAAVAGTTRDILSAPVRLIHREAVLLDSAGIDATPDEIISQARAAALAQAAQVELVCVVIDLTVPESVSFLQDVGLPIAGHALIVANKSDLLNTVQKEQALAWLRGNRFTPVIAVSALRGEGMDELRKRMEESLSLQENARGSDQWLTQRQRVAVAAAAEAVARARSLLVSGDDLNSCADLLAFELREALDALGSVTGAVTTDDLLGQVFARFCIGK